MPVRSRSSRRAPARCAGRAAVLFALAAIWLSGGRAAAADEPAASAPSPPKNKLTFAYYDFSSDLWGVDVNLRHTFRSSTAWVGIYQENDRFDQARIGYEYDYHGEHLTLVPSALVATHGFVGGTLYVEAGRQLFAIGGTGFTNLQPYWNLAFDPNDYVQFGLGYRDRAGSTASIYAIRDVRNHTEQTNTHLYVRRYLPHEWRVTLDAVNERGYGDDGTFLKGWAFTVDVDWQRWFVRVAQDPHVNYTPDSQVRVAGGLRF
ncbi:MAG TPA: hypothetical protein VH417_18890 [Vicinamibacterales bacterium]